MNSKAIRRIREASPTGGSTLLERITLTPTNLEPQMEGTDEP
jgi:hypothetical protein